MHRRQFFVCFKLFLVVLGCFGLFSTDFHSFELLWTLFGIRNDEIGTLVGMSGYISFHFAAKKTH